MCLGISNSLSETVFLSLELKTGLGLASLEIWSRCFGVWHACFGMRASGLSGVSFVSLQSSSAAPESRRVVRLYQVVLPSIGFVTDAKGRIAGATHAFSQPHPRPPKTNASGHHESLWRLVVLQHPQVGRFSRHQSMQDTSLPPSTDKMVFLVAGRQHTASNSTAGLNRWY